MRIAIEAVLAGALGGLFWFFLSGYVTAGVAAGLGGACGWWLGATAAMRAHAARQARKRS